MKKKIMFFYKVLLFTLILLGFTNTNEVYAGITMWGDPGNAGSVCGYYRSGVRRDCKFTARHNFSIPSGYRLDFASGSIYKGCRLQEADSIRVTLFGDLEHLVVA